jgi:hypothetical protein
MEVREASVTIQACPCCESTIKRGAELPAARWIRFGDCYCSDCTWLLSRELVEVGFDRECCPEHGQHPMPKAFPLPFDDY